MFGIYIHIPFCSHRCPFCDFTLVAGAQQPLIDDYVSALCKEVELVDPKEWPNILISIYFGGGTPSLISTQQLEKIFTSVQSRFAINDQTEITMEVNPEDVNETKSFEWKSIGINRISLGVQSMDDQELKRLGRHHTYKQVVEAFEILKKNSLSNISVDLMFGLENQSLNGWMQTLQKTFDLSPKHISTYNLTIEKNTAYEKELEQKKLQLPSDDLQADMMIATKEMLEKHGYNPYEISNASLPNFESRHNYLYWTGKPYLGLGVSSHSFLPHRNSYERWWNTKNIPQYIRSIEQKTLPIESRENLSMETHVEERLMTGLRLKEGIDLQQLAAEGLILSKSIIEQIQLLTSTQYLVQTGHRLSIPQEKMPITSEILLRLFSPLSRVDFLNKV